MKDFDELLEEENISLNIEKQIKRKLNTSIYSRVILVLISIALIIVGVYKGVSTIQSTIYYNPENEEVFLQEDLQGNEFKVLFQTYLGLIYPGQACWIFDDIIDEGNGKYRFNAKIFDSFYSSNYDWETNIAFNINKSEIAINKDGTSTRLVRIADEFIEPDRNPSTFIYDLEYIYNEIKNLPDSSYINVSISFKEYKTLAELISYMNKYDDVAYKWLALKGMNEQDKQIAGGMTLYESSLWDFSEEANEMYPNFYIWNKEDMNADTLKENYLSKLKMLLDHKEFVDAMNSVFGSLLDYDSIQNNYVKAQSEMLAYGVRINVKKAEFLEMLKSGDISKARVHDVKLSMFSK